MLEHEELAAWLRLLASPGIGRTTARRLLAAFGSPQAVFGASRAALHEMVGAAQAAALGREPDGFAERFAATQQWLHDSAPEAPRAVVVLGDPAYPGLLLQTADPPLLLYTVGRAALLGSPALAIVGSRHPTPQGLEHARRFAREAGLRGLTIVSGLASGIDGAAHEGALDAAIPTLAVVGTGLDRVYPLRHRALAARIARAGLLVSEFPIGTPPLAENFPQRNRIIAGLARGTLVVEAALRSGSLITARMALEAGREVFAIPGSINSEQSRGCHALIKQGARLVEQVDDIIEELGPAEARAGPADAGVAAAAQADDPPSTARLLDALGHDPVSLDALLARTGCSIEALSVALLELELAGRVARLPGQLYQRVGYA